MTDFRYRTDPVIRPRMGLIVLQADETIERDFGRLVPESAALHFTRIPSAPDVTEETLQAMENHVTGSASLLPNNADFDVVGYGCTSGTSVIGVDRIRELVQAGIDTTAVTEPVSALTAACRKLEISKLAFLSPYVEAVSAKLRGVLAGLGVNTPVFGSFNEGEEARVARIASASLMEAASKLAREDSVEAIFLSCTNLRTLEIIAPLEAQIGKPVLSSNQTLAWHMCQLGGISASRAEFGQLWFNS